MHNLHLHHEDLRRVYLLHQAVTAFSRFKHHPRLPRSSLSLPKPLKNNKVAFLRNSLCRNQSLLQGTRVVIRHYRAPTATLGVYHLLRRLQPVRHDPTHRLIMYRLLMCRLSNNSNNSLCNIRLKTQAW
jgi:hypothetical protein